MGPLGFVHATQVFRGREAACIEWFDRNVDLIRPEAVVIFTETASASDDVKENKDVLQLFSVEDANISSVEETMFFTSVRTRGLDIKVNVVCHPGALYMTKSDRYDVFSDFVCAFTGARNIIMQNILNQTQESALVDSVCQEIFEKMPRILSYIKVVQTKLIEEEKSHLLTSSDILEMVNQELEIQLNLPTLRKYIAPFKTLKKKGNNILYDLTAC